MIRNNAVFRCESSIYGGLIFVIHCQENRMSSVRGTFLSVTFEKGEAYRD
jgi:hypothetical protein